MCTEWVLCARPHYSCIISRNLPAPHFAGREPEAQRDGAVCLTFPDSDVIESGFEPELDLSCLNHHLKTPPSCISASGEFTANFFNKSIPLALPVCLTCVGETVVTSDSPSSAFPGLTIQWGRQTHLQSGRSWAKGDLKGCWTQFEQSRRASWRKLSPEGQRVVIQVMCDQGLA